MSRQRFPLPEGTYQVIAFPGERLLRLPLEAIEADPAQLGTDLPMAGRPVYDEEGCVAALYEARRSIVDSIFDETEDQLEVLSALQRGELGAGTTIGIFHPEYSPEPADGEALARVVGGVGPAALNLIVDEEEPHVDPAA